MPDKNLESKKKESAYASWMVRRIAGLIVFAALALVGLHLLARADMLPVKELDLVGRFILKTGTDGAPAVPSRDGGAGGTP